MKDLVLKDVSFSYPGGFLAVDNINMRISAGENVAIIGQNGAGKTTTVKMLNGLLTPTAGDVLIGEMNTKNYTTAQIAGTVGYVFQNPDDQIFHSTVEDEVRFGLKMMKLSLNEENRRVDEALELTGLMKQREENPFNLPLSIRKFVTIASIIAMGTEVLIFDEPTAGQDLVGNRRLANIIRLLHEQGKTVITISHDMEFVAANCSRVIVMAKKKIVCSGIPKDIFWDFDSLDKAMLKQPYVSRVCRALGINGNVICLEDAVDQILQGQAQVEYHEK